jgi:hypothetical protein
MASQRQAPKFGQGHASAMFRQGLSELRASLYAESNVAQPPQVGLYGTPPQGEVMQERGTYGRGPGEPPSPVLQGRLPQSSRDERDHEPKPPEPERD